MGQILIDNIADDVIETYRLKARLAGKTLEQYLVDYLSIQTPFTPEERSAFVRENMARFSEPVPSMSLDEIREGLM